MTDNRTKAREILRRCWGGRQSLTEADYEWLARVDGTTEAALDRLQRLAGDTWDWRGKAFTKEAQQHFASLV